MGSVSFVNPGSLGDIFTNGLEVTTGQILAPDGTAVVPGISFGLEPGLGFSRLGSGLIGVSPSRERHINLEIGAATQGASAPIPTAIGTMGGLSFSTDAHSVFFDFDIPRDWDGISNMVLEVHWFPTAGDALLAGETVKWDANYRVIAAGGVVDGGTIVLSSVTYTQSGAGIDKQDIKSDIILVFNDINQPLVVSNTIFIQLDRDVLGDSYSGGAIIPRVDLIYTADKLP